ncbi:uncharacterized protein BDZ99DRAFT_464591 [Mytilinidion resinicola]|uniref:Uncharacterized protein n=1 Tax=Mytilinidion resinicola TaxID=574789 RepID=A0A6A6YI72_9PEZI|nr:uncharacterized protein BDZ99DRAFT_464591 [Mytilinidion resinicola]KAF2807675.1 hypothetical protein BDZ99DRAFT_464591 [Mytilinidion resinicola]
MHSDRPPVSPAAFPAPSAAPSAASLPAWARIRALGVSLTRRIPRLQLRSTPDDAVPLVDCTHPCCAVSRPPSIATCHCVDAPGGGASAIVISTAC